MNTLTDFVVWGSVVAAIMLLTSNSNGKGLVTATTNGYANIVKAETGKGG